MVYDTLVHSCVHTQSCSTLCDFMGSSVLGIFQARILECVAISFSRGSSWPRDGTHISCVSCIGRLFFFFFFFVIFFYLFFLFFAIYQHESAIGIHVFWLGHWGSPNKLHKGKMFVLFTSISNFQNRVVHCTLSKYLN